MVVAHTIRRMHLSDVAWPDVDALDTALALVPVGSTEQHGPHAPLGTDFLNAEAVAAAAEDAYKGDVIVTPAIPVGVAEEHRNFPGTMWVSEDTFRAYVREAAESLASHRFDRIVFVNGHGGNIDALDEVAARLTRDGTAYAVSFTWFDAVDSAVPMGHAGGRETALLRATHPELVQEDRLDDAAENGADRWGDWVSGVNLAHDSHEFTENGVVGDPREGTPSLGEELLDQATENLTALFEELETRSLD